MHLSPLNVTNDYHKTAQVYSTALEYLGTAELLYQAIPNLVKDLQPLPGPILDFGCGTGCSTRVLKQTGINTIGVDISIDMLAQARALDPTGDYRFIKPNVLPFESRSLFLIFSSLVFLEMSSKVELLAAFAEIYRVLHQNGTFIMATASPEMFNLQYKWLSIDNDFPENIHPFSGKKCKIRLKDIDLELFDYYWTDTDYINVAKLAGFSCKQVWRPLVKDLPRKIDVVWLSETTIAPYMFLTFRK